MALDRGVHLYGDPMETKVTVRNTVTVKPGDLMVINGQANMIVALSGASTAADNRAYPLAAAHTKDPGVNQEWFAGVAMGYSGKATTTIGLATAGVFRFPLDRGHDVTIGYCVSATTRLGTFVSTSSTSRSYVVKAKSGANAGCSIGYCVKTESNAAAVDVLLRTLMGPGGRCSGAY